MNGQNGGVVDREHRYHRSIRLQVLHDLLQP